MKAVIFDMDGVLIDSEPIYMQHVLDFYEANGIEVAYEDAVKLAGSSYQKGWELMAQWWKEPITWQEMERLYEEQVQEEDVIYSQILNPYVRYILPRLQNEGFKIAIASSSSMEAIRRMVRECDIKAYFDLLVSGHAFPLSKPDPAIYLHTVRELGVPKEDCVIIEDSSYGIEAGHRAGIKVIGLRDDRFHYDQSKADHLVGDLLEAYHLLRKGKGRV